MPLFQAEQPLRLDAEEPKPGEGFLAFGPGAPGGTEEAMNLSPTGDLEEAAANLFAMMLKFVAHPVELNNGAKPKRINQMTDKQSDRLLYTVITVVSVIGFTIYKMWGWL